MPIKRLHDYASNHVRVAEKSAALPPLFPRIDLFSIPDRAQRGARSRCGHAQRPSSLAYHGGFAAIERPMLLSARTFEELHDCLPRLNVKVPPHPAPRGDTPELYSIVRLLASIPLSPTDFPLQLVKSESPDFALQLGGRSIGIEHTEAVPENAVHESKLRAAQGGGAYLIRAAVAGEPRKSRKQLLEEIAANRYPPPMMGDSVERSWVLAMLHFIEKKIAVAQKPGYTDHDEQWLAIYDNWTAPALDRQHAVTLLREHMVANDPFTVFERIFILTGQILVELARDRMLLHRLNHCRPAVEQVASPFATGITRVARYFPSHSRRRFRRRHALGCVSAVG